MSRRLLTVIGTRPQFIKYAILAQGLRESFELSVVDTGQHYDAELSSDFVREFAVRAPDYNLDAGGGESSDQVGAMLPKLRGVIEKEGPDCLLCVGDTNSTLAAALAGVQAGVRVIHAEAGERCFSGSGNRVEPWTKPEETNRVLVDSISSLLLCFSQRAMTNLEQELAAGERVYTGDIMYDLYLRRVEAAVEGSSYPKALGLRPRDYFFATVHRAANTDDPERLEGIMNALRRLPKSVVIPLHPRTKKALQRFDLWNASVEDDGIVILDPVPWGDAIALNRNAQAVITDSGGVVREAYFSHVPSVFVDDTTAWYDLVDLGWSVMTGADEEAIVQAAQRESPSHHPALFGEGDAAERSVAAIKRWASG